MERSELCGKASAIRPPPDDSVIVEPSYRFDSLSVGSALVVFSGVRLWRRAGWRRGTRGLPHSSWTPCPENLKEGFHGEAYPFGRLTGSWVYLNRTYYVLPAKPVFLLCNASRAVVEGAPNNLYMSGVREAPLFTDPGG